MQRPPAVHRRTVGRCRPARNFVKLENLHKIFEINSVEFLNYSIVFRVKDH